MRHFEHISYVLPSKLYDVPQKSGSKPKGLWFSYPGHWARFSQHSFKWIGSLQISDDALAKYPWHDSRSTGKICCIDMSKPAELYEFISRYKADGYDYEVAWAQVASDYGGVFFKNVESPMPTEYIQFNYSHDGCWIISLDVSCVCLWDTTQMGGVTWKRQRGSAMEWGG